MRRVVVGVDDEGKSYISSDEQVPDTGRLQVVEPHDYESIVARIDPEHVYTAAQPPAGGMLWAIGSVKPGDKPAGAAHAGPMNDRGFHVTKTIDFVYVLDDGLILDVDAGSLTLAAGDAVIMFAANHAWRNASPGLVRFLDVLVSVG